MKKIGILFIALALALALVIPSAAYGAEGKPFTIEPPGNIRPIIYFHGAAGSAAQFETQAMRFMSNGYPANYLASFEYSTAEPVADMEAMNQCLDEFIDALLAETGAEQVDVMGKTWPGAYPSPAYPGLTMNYMASSPERAAKIAHAAYTDSALSGYTAIVPTLGVWGLSGFGGFEREIIGAENVYLPLQGHVQTCTSAEAFCEIFKLFTGQEPTTTDIVPEPPGEVGLAGKVLLYQQNIGPQEDSTLEIWEVDGDTGFRMYGEPNATYDLGEDGAWGPFDAEGGTHYEFALVREGSVQHFYIEPYYRSSYFVRLTTSPVGGGIGAYIHKSDHHSAINIIRYKEIWGNEGVNNDAITIIDSVNNVNVVTPITCPSSRRVISLFLFDANSDGVTNIDTVPFPFGFIGFMSASDIYMPAVDPPDGTISVVMTPRGSGGRTQVINVPNWTSLIDRITVQFREYVQDINTFQEYMNVFHLSKLGWEGKSLVRTQYGKVRGAEAEGDTFVWKGIPYAQPPVDELRWKAPQDPIPWDGVLETVDDPERCLQPAVAQTWHSLGYNHGSEDCLYLNIWRPQTEETDLPVYFWIHGGSNNFGGCADYNGAGIASRSNMVVAVIQYRLGPFGWFNHPALHDGDPKDDSGNFGTLDCIKALEWVQDNIAAFGGDPDNVTVAGESAGAHNTMSMVISPLASGLFHGAVSESGGMQIVTVEHGIAMANATIDNLLVADGTCETIEEAAAYRAGMSDAEIEAYLRAKPGEDILNAQLVPREETHNAYADGYVIPGGFVETIESGDYNHVPIILGSNEYETKDFIPLFAPLLGKPNWFYVYDLFDPDFDPTHEWTMGEIFPTAADSIIYEACGYYGALNWKAHYVDEIARPLQEQQDDVYAYLFQWGGPGSGPVPFDFVFGAAHAMEIPFFWGADESLFGYSFNEDNRPGREELQDDMMAYIANFAASGDPNGPGLYEWEEWSNDVGEAKCIQFDATYTEADISMMDWEVTSTEVAMEVMTLPYWVQPYVWAFIWP